MRTLLQEEISTVTGGHGTGWFWTVVGMPHVIIGLIEMYNYTREWIDNGCEVCDEDNYFKKDVCSIIT